MPHQRILRANAASELPGSAAQTPGWTHYETAKPGTFRLVPPPARQAALARDHATMAPMFIGAPIEFDGLLRRLQTAEQQLNDGSQLGID